MIERVIDYCARNQFIVFLFVAFAAVAGVYAMANIPLDAIPDLSDVQVIIWTEWMGRHPGLVEDQITYPIASTMLAVPRATTVRGFSMFGMSYVYVLFEDGTDLYWARSRVLEYLSGIAGRLPQGVTPVLGPDATGVGWGFEYALVDKTGQNDLQQLRTFQDWYLRYWLASVDGVAEVASIGGFEKQYQVDLDPDRLRAYNLPVHMVIEAIRMSNQDVGGRTVEFAGREYSVRGRGYIRSLADLAQVAVGATPGGTPVLLRDVADIHLGPEQRRGVAEFNGEGEVVGGIVVVRFGENVLKVIERVKERLRDQQAALPPGVELVVTYDRSGLIERSIHTLTRTLIEEAIIVSLVIILFLLHPPSALRAIITLPIAVALAFIPMYLLHVTANIMSLGGIAIAIGAMVDEAVVMIENVHKKLEHAPPGADQRELTIAACKEIGRPMFFALLIITVSFLPVFTLEAQEGRLFRPLAYTKTFSMFAAALLSVTFAPALMVLLSGGKIIPESRHPISIRLQRYYDPWMRALMRRRLLSISIAVIAVGSSIPIWFHLGHEFMPPLNEWDMLYMPTTNPGISITEATRILQVQDQVIKSFPEVQTVFGKAGRAETSTDPAPLSMVETTIQLKPQEEWPARVRRQRWYSSWAPEWLKAHLLRHLWPEQRRLTWDELKTALDTAVDMPGWVDSWTMPIKTRIDMLTTGIKTPVGVKIYGADLKVIERLGEQIEAVLGQVPGTDNVYAERVTGGYYLDFIPNREQAARYGLNVEQVEDIVETAIGGMDIAQTVEGRERYTINVRYARELRDEVDKLRRVLVPTPRGAQVPISDLADIRFTTGPDMIKEENGQLTGWVYINIKHRDVGGYVNEAKRVVEKLVPPPTGYRYEWAGQYEFMQRVRKRLMVVVPITLVIIVVMLYLEFKTIAQTCIVLLSVPFALTGSIWLLYLLHYNMSIAVAVGMIALAGLAAETGIVMIVYLDEAFHRHQREGRMRTQHDLFEAITEGAVQRIRPKLMTVACIFMGLIPIMWSHGAGADVMRRIAAPMIGGVFTSTILTLEIVPAIYSLWRQRWITWVPEGEDEITPPQEEGEGGS